ncbi:MAG: ABC transporter substrate-binding protein [Deltaproteobacteria bacterium]|nr:ABC transporter substrate-binding protein [Deltaproteobacteria bacterium]
MREEVPALDTTKRLYETALDEYKRGEREKAARHFQEFIIQHPRTSLTDDAFYYIGETYLQTGEYSAAAAQFESLLRNFPSSPKYQEAQWSLANCYFKMGRYKEALKTARRLLPSVEDRPLWRGRLFIFFADCHAAMHDPMAALSWYARAWRELPPAERKGVRERTVTLLDQDLPPDRYREIDIIYRGTFISTYARYRLAQLHFRDGGVEEAADVLRGALEEASGEEFYPLLEDLWRKIQRGVKEEVVLGCILPLQGRAKPFGIKALQGIQLAIGAFQTQQWPFKVRLLIWDSQGDPSRAKEGVRALAKEGVIAIIGPLLSNTALAAVEEADTQGVPLITLSPLKGIAQKGRYIFQNSLTHASQVKALVKYAFEELGIVAYAILYPRNPYGLTFRKLFQQEVERYGGELVVAASYTNKQTDFGDVIKGMVEYQPTKDPKEKPRPIINFGAIFIPDDFKKINLLAPQLAYYDIMDVQLLGTNGWDSPELVRGSGKFVEGAVFVDGFFKDSPLPWVRYFVREFEGIFNFSPTLLDALGFDSTEVILKTISNKELWSREALREALLSLREYVGVSGLKGFNPDGEGTGRLFLLTVSHGRIRQILSAE